MAKSRKKKIKVVHDDRRKRRESAGAKREHARRIIVIISMCIAFLGVVFMIYIWPSISQKKIIGNFVGRKYTIPEAVEKVIGTDAAGGEGETAGGD